MKKVLSGMIALLFAGAMGTALAQTDTSVLATPKNAADRGLIRGLHVRLQEQTKMIRAGVASQKLTEDEAKALHDKVKSILKEMISDIKSNGQEKLTDGQVQQLNQELDQNADAIHDAEAP
jgi:hypothetical protein